MRVVAKIILGAMAGLLVFFLQVGPGFPAGERSSCVTCHTNDRVMKMLYKPPALEGGGAKEGAAGAPPPVRAEERYKGFLVDAELLKNDPHLRMGCKFCHQGNDAGGGREAAHTGLVKRPSDNPQICGRCHKQIAGAYEKSLHYTTAGLKSGVHARFSAAEANHFDEKVFEASCRSCHASCGDCHVKAPPVGGIGPGLISGHKFIRKDEGKTCASCHGDRVYPEFTGDYGGHPDVHRQKGMICTDCHKKAEMHGDGIAYASRQEVKNRPSCTDCHKIGDEKLLTTKMAHAAHRDKVTCYGCHSAGEYRQCSSCHDGAGATAKPGFLLGLNPRDKKMLTTLRMIPTARDTFAAFGIGMEHYDTLPNFWNSPVHNIQKRTDRTRSCDACHMERSGFLKREMLPENGSRANEGLIAVPRSINK